MYETFNQTCNNCMDFFKILFIGGQFLQKYSPNCKRLCNTFMLCIVDKSFLYIYLEFNFHFYIWQIKVYCIFSILSLFPTFIYERWKKHTFLFSILEMKIHFIVNEKCSLMMDFNSLQTFHMSFQKWKVSFFLKIKI